MKKLVKAVKWILSLPFKLVVYGFESMVEDVKELMKVMKEKDYKEARWCVLFILLSPIRALGFLLYAVAVYGEPIEHQLRDMWKNRKSKKKR